MKRALVAVALALLALAIPPRAFAQSQSTGPVTFHASTGTATDDLDVQVDVAGPVIQILTPVAGSVIGGTSTTINGTVNDFADFDGAMPGNTFQSATWALSDVQLGVRVLSGTVPVVDGHFTIPDLPLVIGFNAVTVSATDAVGFAGSNVTFFQVDPNAPAAALSNFHDGQATLFQNVPIDIDFAAPTTIVSVNGVADGRSFPAGGLASDVLDESLEFGTNTFELALQAAERRRRSRSRSTASNPPTPSRSRARRTRRW